MTYDIDPVPSGPFRSTLERRFSEHVEDIEHLVWWYEPESYQIDTFAYYTPDFEVALPNHWPPAIVEIKPTLSMALNDKRLRKLARIVSNQCIMVWPWPDGWAGFAVTRGLKPDDTLWSRESFYDYVSRLDRMRWP